MTALWSAVTATAETISRANLGFVLAAFAVDTLALVVMAFRWRLLLRSFHSGASLWETLLAYSAGVCVCNITPARAIGGDACRAALIPRPGGVPPVKAVAASVVYDRATDLFGFVLLGAIALPVLKPQLSHWIVAAVVAVTLVLVARPLYRRFASQITQWHQAIRSKDLRGSLIAAVGCSMIIWLLDISRIMLVGAAFDVWFTPPQAATVSLLRLASGLVPVPAGIGVVDGALVAGFIWLGLPTATAVALAIVERAIVYGWGTALGAVSLLLLGGTRALKRARAGSATLDAAS